MPGTSPGMTVGGGGAPMGDAVSALPRPLPRAGGEKVKRSRRARPLSPRGKGQCEAGRSRLFSATRNFSFPVGFIDGSGLNGSASA